MMAVFWNVEPVSGRLLGAASQNTARHLKTRRDISKHGATSQNTAQHLRTRRNISKPGATSQNTAQHLETRRSISEHSVTSQNTAIFSCLLVLVTFSLCGRSFLLCASLQNAFELVFP
jgi:hypothetical protein